MGNKGLTLIYNIFLIILIMLISVAIARMIFSASSVVSSSYGHLRAYYLAEGGIEYAKDKLRENPSWSTPLTKVECPNGYCEIMREPASKFVTSTGFITGARAIIAYNIETRTQREE